MMEANDNPVLFGTQKQYCWNIWQLVYGERLPNPEEFAKWWDASCLVHWDNERMLFTNAWWSASDSLARVCKEEFNGWFQQLIDDQGKLGR